MFVCSRRRIVHVRLLTQAKRLKPRGGVAWLHAMRTLLALLTLFSASIAHAETYTLYVAARDSDAHKAAEKLADGTKSWWFPNMGKAYDKIGELLKTDNDVRVHVAQGTYSGLYAL